MANKRNPSFQYSFAPESERFHSRCQRPKKCDTNNQNPLALQQNSQRVTTEVSAHD